FAVCAIAGLAAVALPRAAGAATLFVSTRGSDARYCLRAAPCRHIAHAVSVAHTGDRIEIGPGQFVENVTLPARLRSVLVDGAGSGKLQVTGSSVYQNVVTADGGSGAGLFTQASGRGRRLLANSTIAFNTVRGANGQGGGVFGDGLAFDGDTIADNSAASGG